MPDAGPGRRPRLCIVSLFTWPLFDPACKSAFGGSEVRIAAIAKGLARRGSVDVSLVVWDHGQGERTMREGVCVFAWPDPAPAPVSPDDGVAPAPQDGRMYRFRLARVVREAYADGGGRRAIAFVPYLGLQAVRLGLRLGARAYYGSRARVSHLRSRLRARMRASAVIGSYAVDRTRFALLDRIDPDVVLVHGAHSIAAEVVAWANARDRASIFVAGSDDDFVAEHRQRGSTTAYGDVGRVVAYAVENATVHVVQTPAQAERLRAVYGREGRVIRNPIDLTRQFPRNEDGTVLWVGKSDAIKRPDLAIAVARLIPEAQFVLVMNPSNPELHRQVETEARALGNVRIERAVPFEEIESLFARASVFLSTSKVEGFPNTFLQAAKYAVPVASLTVDPGAMLSEHRAGVVAEGSVERLAREIQAMLRDDSLRGMAGARALAYAREHHDADKVLTQFELVVGAATASARAE